MQGVPIEHGDTALVCAMPEEWRGKDALELSQISGIASLRFCHASGFLAAAIRWKERYRLHRLQLQ